MNISVERQRIIQIVGFSNTGKTTLVTSIIRKLSEKKIKVSTIKSAPTHQIVDHGKDSDKNFFSGAISTAVLFSNGTQITFNELSLEKTIKLIGDYSDSELIIIEGFKKRNFPKIIVWTKDIDLSLFNLDNVVGVYCPKNIYRENRTDVELFVEKYGFDLFISVEQIIKILLEELKH
ncbi:MAG: molybdopterin-guanine dinucleotide biosynthesis protein B [Candidatus Heimdallarchaeum aukensis]|uniref:Molybdopterin-guanine dinucleotide biosynthesis protein B n=1 Tax=Candidatus Heimdallarchaeum aukensis TaxID=2876573 RepID=A0A9Y1BN27_9ARCH|nr:MAG: molybdopterin-guanine dinucleotide biosynthesis protein B [Candidatus Heimdallarchaeum aukensis]